MSGCLVWGREAEGLEAMALEALQLQQPAYIGVPCRAPTRRGGGYGYEYNAEVRGGERGAQ